MAVGTDWWGRAWDAAVRAATASSLLALHPVYSPLAYVLISLLVAVAALVHGYSGFGGGIIGMTLLSFLAYDMERMSVVITLNILATILVLLKTSSVDAGVDWRRSGLLLIGIAVGMPVGYWFIVHLGDHPVFRIMLGTALSAFALHGFLNPQVSKELPRAVAMPAGLVGGFFGGALVSGGPPLVLYLYSQVRDPRTMKATVQAIFLAMTLFRILLIGAGGIGFTPGIVWLGLATIPLSVVALLGGHALSKRASAETFKRVVYAMIIALGVAAVGRGIVQWLG